MKLRRRITPLFLGIALLAAGAGICPAQSPDAAKDPVLAALEEVRPRRADLFLPESSVLGKLPGPAELAAAQPKLRELFSSQTPLSVDFSTEMLDDLQRSYTHYTFSGESRSGVTTLGVTGAFVGEVRFRRELIVIKIDPDSPADGVLQIDDVIIGANGRMFRQRRDPRIPMGYALYESSTEKLGGKLTLHLVRQGKAMNVVVEIPVLPPYAEQWPYDCERTAAIGNQMLELMIEKDLHGGRGPWWPLFMMGSGDERALEIVRRSMYRGLKDEYVLPDIGHSWSCSFNLVGKCEYYLLTGDSNVLPQIKFYCDILQGGQSGAGGWGHRCPCSGYGEVNAVGAVALMGLALARECGVELNPEALAQSIRYFGRFAVAGMPYGDHSSGLRCNAGNNGKAACGALAFRFLGEEDIGTRWSRSVCHMWTSPEAGHAEGIFNLAWDPLAASHGTRDEYAVQMNNRIWYYEMARTGEGGMRFFRGGFCSYPLGQTTAVGIPYMIPRQKIYVTGAKQSVFGRRPPNEKLAAAAQLYKDKQWAELKTSLTAYLASSAPDQDYARKLLDAYERMEKNAAVTIELAQANIEAGNPLKAKDQLLALEKLLGEKRPAITQMLGMNTGFAREEPKAKRTEFESEATVFAYDPIEPPSYDWEFILPPAAQAKESHQETYKLFRPRHEDDVPAGRWTDADYDAKDWETRAGTFLMVEGKPVWIRRKFNTIANPKSYKNLMLIADGCSGELYVNGYKMADFRDGELYLKDGSPAVLKQGDNVLAARLDAPPHNKKDVDIGLKASPPLIPDLKGVLDDF